MLGTPKPPLAVTADKAYDSEKVRQQIKDEGALPIIPSRCNATRKAYCPKRFYRRRHKIENYFCRIKDRVSMLLIPPYFITVSTSSHLLQMLPE